MKLFLNPGGFTERVELSESPLAARMPQRLPYRYNDSVTHREMKTLKTRLLSQSAHIEALVRPEIDGDAVTVEVKGTKAMPSGLLGRVSIPRQSRGL